MGTRADYYAGAYPVTDYLGSTPTDGDPATVARWGLGARYDRVEDFVDDVHDLLDAHGQRRSAGWPWPWDDSRATDYAYCWDSGTHDVMVSCFGSPLLRLADILEGVAPAFDHEAEKVPFPDQSFIKAVRRDSGYAVHDGGWLVTAEQAHGVSDDGRVLWVVTRTPSGGVLTSTWQKEPGVPPWDSAEIDQCLARARTDAGERQSGRSTVRRYRAVLGWVPLSQVSVGLPTLWWPRVSVRGGGFAVAWLRGCVSVYALRVR